MFKTILLPVDLNSEASWTRAAPAAIQLARDNDAVLHVLSILPDFGVAIVGSYFEEGFEEKAMHDLGERLKTWVAENVPDDLEVHPHIIHGRIHAEILGAAEQVGADCIVMASHRPEATDYLIGPHAAHVVRHAPISVFVVRQ